MLMSEFGKFIKQIRESKNLTLTEVAEGAKINHSHLSRIESGERNAPKAPTIQKLARALRHPFIDLMEKAGYFEGVDEEKKQGMKNYFTANNELDMQIDENIRAIFEKEDPYEIGNLKVLLLEYFGDEYSEFQEENNNSLKFTPEGIREFLNYVDPSMEHKSEFHSAVQNFLKKSPSFGENEKEFISKIELSDKELIAKFDFSLDGEELSEDDIKNAIAFLRFQKQQQMKP